MEIKMGLARQYISNLEWLKSYFCFNLQLKLGFKLERRGGGIHFPKISNNVQMWAAESMGGFVWLGHNS